VSNGPALEFTVDGELPGTELKRSAGSWVKVSAKAFGHAGIGIPTHLTVVGNAGLLKEIANQGKAGELKLEFELPIEKSQWLVASTVCNNAAVAHTSPVYIVVNGRPTWDAQRGPAVIDKQLAAIANVEKEFESGHDPRSQGIRDRLKKARSYYSQLQRNMRLEGGR
jgi:hypothetical protein